MESVFEHYKPHENGVSPGEVLRDDFGLFVGTDGSGRWRTRVDNFVCSLNLGLDKGAVYSLYDGGVAQDADGPGIWRKFSDSIISENRFFPDTRGLLDQRGGDSVNREEWETTTLGIAVRNATTILDPGSRLFRGRSLQVNVAPFVNAVDFGPPPAVAAAAGRLNPHGIGHIYLASDVPTVIAELRAEVSSRVSVGEFVVDGVVEVVDLSKPWTARPFDIDLDAKLILAGRLLRHLQVVLNQPILSSVSHREYLPTQYLGEFVKHAGIDGIRWSSAQGTGDNVMLFSSEKLTFHSAEVQVVKYVNYVFSH